MREFIFFPKAKSGVNEHITPHIYKQSFATLLWEAGYCARIVQELLGHNDVKTTLILLSSGQVYIHVLNKRPKSVCSPLDGT